ncbi:MAG: alpha/beta hydrolase [Nitrospirota bacterium]|nr:alpha/beta hydrolase [Nitrospirota bacterium]
MSNGEPTRYRRAVRIHGFQWGLSRVLGATLMALLAGAGMAMLAQHLWEQNDRHRYPAPGTTYDVGGYRLHLNCLGDGSPTVVLEAAVGEWSIHWLPVMARLAPHARVCAYDRAGYGWSEVGPRPRDAAHLAADLSALLRAAREDGPLVLAAHGEGAVVAGAFIARHPDRVLSLVLVDAATPEFTPLAEAHRSRLLRHVQHALPWAHFGAAHFLGLPPGVTPPPQTETFSRHLRYPGYYETVAAEFHWLLHQAYPARTYSPDPARPRFVLYRETPVVAASAAGLPQGWTAEGYNTTWNKAQAALAEGAVDLPVPGAPGNLLLDQPERVADTVLRALQAARNKKQPEIAPQITPGTGPGTAK